MKLEQMLNNMDASCFNKFINMDEMTAKSSLKSGDIIGYLK